MLLRKEALVLSAKFKLWAYNTLCFRHGAFINNSMKAPVLFLTF